MPGHDDHRGVLRLRRRLADLRRLPSVHHGHRQVHDDDVGPELLRLVDRLASVARGVDDEPGVRDGLCLGITPCRSMFFCALPDWRSRGMRSRPRTLRQTITFAVVTLALLAGIGAGALVGLTSVLHKASVLSTLAVERVRLAEEVQRDIL